jgi:hypothetical protein
MNILGDSRNVGVVQVERWHTLSLARAADDGRNQFPVLIAQRYKRAKQARAALVAAPQVGAMASCAVDTIDGLAPRDNLG